jgi:hypothetical protein
VLGMEPMASCTVGESSTMELHLLPTAEGGGVNSGHWPLL